MGGHVDKGHEPILMSAHRLLDTVAEESPADIIGQQRQSLATRESQLVIMVGLIEVGDSFSVGRKECHHRIVSRHCWTSQQWHPAHATHITLFRTVLNPEFLPE